MKSEPIGTLTILGMGLMGGSLGLAVRRAGLTREVRGYARRPETRALALSMGAVDRVFEDPAAACVAADLVVLCVPVLAAAGLADLAMPGAGPDCLFTDVGSTKAEVLAELAPIAQRHHRQFIGSHPIAGSHLAGMEAACGDLYEGAVVVVTPTEATPVEAVRRIAALWEAVGARVATMSATAHDRMLARTSHLPHVIAAILAQTVLDSGRETAAPFCGSGFRDATRIARGSDEMWHDICKTNTDAICDELARFRRVLDRVAGDLSSGDFTSLRQFLDDAGRLRRALDEGGKAC